MKVYLQTKNLNQAGLQKKNWKNVENFLKDLFELKLINYSEI